MKKIGVLLCSALLMLNIFNAEQFTHHAYALTEEETAWVDEARLALQEILAEREVMALVYLGDEYSVRSQPAENSAEVVKVYSGHTVFVQDIAFDDDYQAWTKVKLYAGGVEHEGYISRNNLACSDERFLQWEADYGMNPGVMNMYNSNGATADLKAQEIEQFPESYRTALTALSEQHPNWTFVPQKTNLDWSTVIANEMKDGRSLMHKSYADCTGAEAYDNIGWYYATEEVLTKYMDPRNSLNEDAIFQFEQLTYNEQYHTEAAVSQFLKGTFMENDGTDATLAPGTIMHFDTIFWVIGAEEVRKVSPFHLAARVLQEQGVKGGSALISGNYEGAGGIYRGYYNYFNVGATGTTQQQVIENGLKYAKNAYFEGKPYPWNNAYASILGGTEVISTNYIRKGQDTLYLQKYNVGPDSQYPHYTHQYMQNVAAPTSEAKNIKKLYQSAGALESTFVFKIPVYENMHKTNSSAVYNGVDYSDVYDVDYYYNNNSDLAAALGYNKMLLLEHFVNAGMAEGRQASEEFNLNAYKENSPDLVKAFGEDNKSYYMHYINAGKKEGRTAVYPKLDAQDYVLVYDAAYYHDNNPDLAGWLGFDEKLLLKHFVNHGMSEGRFASEDFVLSVYKEKNPDLVQAFGGDNKSYYMHYINAGKAEGRIAAYPKLDAQDYVLVYDAAYYHDNNPDLASWLGYNEKLLLEHFVNHGMSEGRTASEDFVLSVYKEKNPDLVEVFGEDNKSYYMHYIASGHDEGRVAN